MDEFIKNGESIITNEIQKNNLDVIKKHNEYLLNKISEGMPQHDFDALLKSTLNGLELSFKEYYKYSTEGFKLKD